MHVQNVQRLDWISSCPDIQEKNTKFYDCSIDLDGFWSDLITHANVFKI